MKIITKIISCISLTVIGVISFFAGQMSLIEGYNPIRPDIDTQFSKDYNEQAFMQIKIGDDTTSVINKIGFPSNISLLDERVYWNYSEDGKSPIYDFAWLQRSVIFDDEWKVCQIVKRVVYD